MHGVLHAHQKITWRGKDLEHWHGRPILEPSSTQAAFSSPLGIAKKDKKMVSRVCE